MGVDKASLDGCGISVITAPLWACQHSAHAPTSMLRFWVHVSPRSTHLPATGYWVHYRCLGTVWSKFQQVQHARRPCSSPTDYRVPQLKLPSVLRLSFGAMVLRTTCSPCSPGSVSTQVLPTRLVRAERSHPCCTNWPRHSCVQCRCGAVSVSALCPMHFAQ